MSCDHTPTIRRIIAVAAAFYVPLSPAKAERLWSTYSDHLCAGWLLPIDEAYAGEENNDGDFEILHAVCAYLPILENLNTEGVR
jgi:hypothetical protein